MYTPKYTPFWDIKLDFYIHLSITLRIKHRWEAAIPSPSLITNL